VKLLVDEFARLEIESAVEFYFSERRELATRFLAAIDHAATLIQENPWIGRRVNTHHHRVTLDRFPYLLIYRIHEAKNLIRLVAVSHQRRRPGYWSDRLDESCPSYVVLSAVA